MADDITSANPSQQESYSLTFRGLTHEVRCGVGYRYLRDKKCVLNGICGAFQSGELTGIIGPSGCGKTTLMDLLTGYIKVQSGSIQLNGVERNLKDNCSYIMQDDLLHPLLTVKEAMKFVSGLKMKSKKIQEKRINDILSSLTLAEKKDTQASKLSGGEKKRLAVAVELITEPPIMFFDEPTRGLDSLSAEKCLRTLKSVASRGVMVVCSIHQPSRSMMEMFDHIYVMARGMCTFQGSGEKLIEYLHSLALTCPLNYNPADHILEITFKEYGDNLARLVSASGNGTNQDWRSQLKQETASSGNTNHNSTYISSKNILSTDVKTAPIFFKYVKRSSYVSFATQFLVLLKRNATNLYREKLMVRMKLFLHAAMGLFIGTMYWQIGNDAAFVYDNYSLLFYSVMFLMFTSYSAMIVTFHLKLRITTREYFNGWYSLRAFYLAENIVDMSFQILCSTSYCLVVYIMSGQPQDSTRFLLFALTGAMVSLISQTIGLIVGVALRLKHAVVFGSMVIMPWVVFAGFFLRLEDAPWYSHWLFHINFLKYGFQSLILSIYGYNRPRMTCSQDYCHHVIPAKFLKDLHLQHADYSPRFIVLLLILIMIKFVAFHALKYQLKNKRKKLDDEE